MYRKLWNTFQGLRIYSFDLVAYTLHLGNWILELQKICECNLSIGIHHLLLKEVTLISHK